jgi:hypothetical protein
VSLSKLHIRPTTEKDYPLLDKFRGDFAEHGLIELPWGYNLPNSVETAVAEVDGIPVGAVAASKTVLINFMKDVAAKGTDVYSAVLLLERTLTYAAQQIGITESYCAIPNHMQSYIKLVQKSGYVEAFPHCTVLRRPLLPLPK